MQVECQTQTLNPPEFYQLSGNVSVNERHINRLIKDFIRLKSPKEKGFRWKSEMAGLIEKINIFRKEGIIQIPWIAHEKKQILQAETIDDLLDIICIGVVFSDLNIIQRLRAKVKIKKIVQEESLKNDLESRAKILSLHADFTSYLQIYECASIKQEVTDFLNEVKTQHISPVLFINIPRLLEFSGVGEGFISDFFDSLNLQDIFNLNLEIPLRSASRCTLD